MDAKLTGSSSALTAYPDQAWHGIVDVVANEPIAQETYRLRILAPEVARRIIPGQFLMLRLLGTDDPLLGRPLALYDVVLDAKGEPRWVDIVYITLGKMTRRLAKVSPGSCLEVWGPLGNGFPPEQADRWVLVAGGIGQTPFLAFSAEVLGKRRYGNPPRRFPTATGVTLCYGVRTKARLACVEDFQSLGVEVLLATDDGSAGYRGLVTELFSRVIEGTTGRVHVVACGPEMMMAECARIACECGVPCYVSLETPMACGLGICFSCAVKVRTPDGGWDYRRACVDGPVFRAEDLVW